MIKKPREAQADEQEDLLDQIIAQGLDKMNTPVRAKTGPEFPADETTPVPKPADSEDAAPPSADRQNGRSSVYLYMLILFGAAFLLLLLAYFVQQRNSNTTISDLRDSMTISRQELLDEIKGLQGENEKLSEELDRLNGELTQWQERYEEKDKEAADLWNDCYSTQEELFAWISLWTLEQHYQAGEYESCAAVLLLQLQSQYSYHTPYGAEKRYEEIVKAVIKAGILDEDYVLHPEDYKDLLDVYLGVIVEPEQ